MACFAILVVNDDVESFFWLRWFDVSFYNLFHDSLFFFVGRRVKRSVVDGDVFFLRSVFLCVVPTVENSFRLLVDVFLFVAVVK